MKHIRKEKPQEVVSVAPFSLLPSLIPVLDRSHLQGGSTLRGGEAEKDRKRLKLLRALDYQQSSQAGSE